MKNLSKLLLASAMLGVLAIPAFAQGVNTVPQVGVVSAFQKQYSYSASSIALVPASAATDIFCISPATTAPQRSISIKQITIGGTAGTAITTPFLVYKRSAVGTSGTAATGIALPVAVQLNPNDPAASAVLIAYTGNPTVAATPILMDAITVSIPVTTAAAGTTTAILGYGEAISQFYHSLDLTKTSLNQICVNLNGATVSSGVLNITMKWTEQ